MNQKDYKEIAGIIDKTTICGHTDTKLMVKWLAEYFEKEDTNCVTGDVMVFNRQQFLKDCGVD